MEFDDKKNHMAPEIDKSSDEPPSENFSFDEVSVDEEDEEILTPPKVIIRFFIIPLALVVGVLTLYLGFRWMVGGQKSTTEYVQNLASPYPSTREHALYDLTAYLRQHPDAGKDEYLFRSVLDAFRKRENFRREIRTYLALALGYMGNPDALPALKEALHDKDSTLIFYTIWALGRIGDKKAIPWILPFLESTDPGLREIAVLTLGELHSVEHADAIQKRLADENPSVRMNSCFVLAQWNVPQAGDCILTYLHREFVERLTKITLKKRELY